MKLVIDICKKYIRNCKKHRVVTVLKKTKEYEYGYIEPITVIKQKFYLERRFLYFHLVPKLLFEEEVPTWAEIQHCALGYTNWKSDAPKILHKLCADKKWHPGWSIEVHKQKKD